MDLNRGKRLRRSVVCCIVLASTGCVAPQAPVTTVWQRLGIPQAGAGLRDGLVNRHGKFPGLEKKPPVLALADPANLIPEKPEMIKAAAAIKQDQDLKKQKIKAIKFLAQVNCGCYNKDGKVEAAFLAALDDCDPDVRKAAIEGLDEAAGEDCAKCNVCGTTCNTKKLNAKLEQIACGLKDGCHVEPVKEIRDLAKALLRKCPPPSEPPIEPEELIPPPPQPVPLENLNEGELQEGDERLEIVPKPTAVSLKLDQAAAPIISAEVYQQSNLVQVASNLSEVGSSRQRWEGASLEDNLVVNPDQLVVVQTVAYDRRAASLVIQTPIVYQIPEGCRVVIVGSNGQHCLGTVARVQGERIVLGVDQPNSLEIRGLAELKIGLVSE